MKKILITVIVLALLIIGYAYDQFGWCKRLLLGGPTTHVIQEGEYLSQIAREHYGRADYWRELALINRAPDCNLVFPGEEIIIPSLDVVKEIRRTRWLSKVNAYVRNEEDIIARLNRGEEPVLAENVPKTMEDEPKTTPERLLEAEQSGIMSETEHVDTLTEFAQQPFVPEQENVRSASSLGLVLALIGIVFVASLIAFVLIRKKKRSQQITIVDDEELNLIDEDEESEPDYQEYLRNKSRQESDVLVG
ncbi:MAG: LysM peptidoglycan-binding domain-containing protein [bacterium]|nr:MAG: LysM peptidoglycan-binding domain-containing protein [bacterium]